MNKTEFWKIIDQSYQTSKGKQDNQLVALSASLSGLSESNLIKFDDIYRDQLDKSYHWDLWAAAFIINGGCSDDGFDYFRDWLISLGRDTFEAALKDPQTLISFATPYETEFEEFRYVMEEAYEEKFSKQLPFGNRKYSTEPKGVAWDEEELDEKFPQLSEWIETTMPSTLYTSEPHTENPKRKWSIFNWFSKRY